ncbi:unnamed protein product [Somion occarium]|uniref:F-box domain-containing protein n=1 Tax=Somion occarium TaxID=3059160 RepID=A0ABP1DK17_9APHY
MSMSRPRSIFEVFPVELLAMIKAEIPISDLRTHVCLYKAALRFADLYEDDDEEDEFWQASCILSGIGFIEDEDAWTTWKSVAFECLDEDGFCKHPQCGGARLEANTRGMVKFMNLSAKPTMQELQEAILQCKNVEWVNHSPLLKHFCFGSPMARREHGHFHHLEVEEDTYLDHPDIKEDDPPEYQWKLHPIARRKNLYGVTMDDVVTRLHESIDRDVTLSPGAGMLSRYCNISRQYVMYYTSFGQMGWNSIAGMISKRRNLNRVHTLVSNSEQHDFLKQTTRLTGLGLYTHAHNK